MFFFSFGWRGYFGALGRARRSGWRISSGIGRSGDDRRYWSRSGRGNSRILLVGDARMNTKRIRLRYALQKRPGIYRLREIQEQFGSTKSLTRLVLREMERDGVVVRWGPRGATRWQVLPREINPKATLWYNLGWPDPAQWPREGVPMGYVGV